MSVESWARELWDYHRLGRRLPRRADVLIALGGHDRRVAEWAATLFLEGRTPWFVATGGVAHQEDLLAVCWDGPEADEFARIARERGVPADRILLEREARNTGENAVFSRRLLAARGLRPATAIVVTKPYMERRALATFEKAWPELRANVTSPPIPFEAYPAEGLPLDKVIHIMTGDFERILRYPALGYQTVQPVPRRVYAAYQALVQAGYTRHLLPQDSR